MNPNRCLCGYWKLRQNLLCDSCLARLERWPGRILWAIAALIPVGVGAVTWFVRGAVER